MKKVLYILQQSVIFSIVSLCYIIGKLTDAIGIKLINYLDDDLFNE